MLILGSADEPERGDSSPLRRRVLPRPVRQRRVEEHRVTRCQGLASEPGEVEQTEAVARRRNAVVRVSVNGKQNTSSFTLPVRAIIEVD